MAPYVIGVDLGGTRIRAARLDQNLKILQRVETLTLAHQGLEPTLQRIQDQIRQVMTNADECLGIGISAPGPLNPETGVIVSPPNLPGWHDVPLGNVLHETFNIPIFAGNDANVAALAEAALGAARGYRHVIYVTVSTGVGSGIITDGRLLLGKSGLAAEAGHMQMLVGERVSSLELETAGPDMAEQAKQRIKAGEHSALFEMVNGKIDQIDAATIGKAAQNGDPLALSIVTRSGTILGLGIVNLLHLFNPEIVIIGGGVSNLGNLLFDPMHTAIQQYCIDDAYWKDTIFTTPHLGEDVSIYGAAALVITDGGKKPLEMQFNN
ncbi:MAG: ROK family protein [Phototrophicales bacterium]